MKKHLIALAITSAFAAPAAFADVEMGPVAVYGTLNTAVEFLDVTSNGAVLANTAVSQTRLADQTSKLGFKFKHDLGSGLFALGQLESRFYVGNNGSATDNKAELGGRNTFAGLGNNSFGTVRLGRYDNAYKLSSKQMGSLRDNMNDASDDTGDKQILNRLGGRQGDIIAYESPNWGGVTVLASYNMGKDSTGVATDLMPQFAAAIGYKAGPFTIGVGTTSLNNAAWQLDSKSAATPVNSAGAKTLQAWQVGAGYTFGEYTIGLVTERTNSSLDGAASFEQAQTTTGLVGGYKSGPMKLELRYAMANDVTGTVNGSEAALTKDTGATQIGIAMGYQLHKNVQLIGSYTRLDNAKNASYTSASGFSLAKGVDMNQIALGLAVSF
jgi:predicted porin